MTHGSLFSGIGGFDLAAEWMGWENKFHCEWNEFEQKVLKHYWPKAISYGDITKTDFTIWRNRIDILSGGFPCQPYSVAGKRLGSEDERHLWPEMLRAIREIQPRWIVGENVSGLVNWNGGVVFDDLQNELEIEGYEVESFILPAASVGGLHLRERIWIIAYSNQKRGTIPIFAKNDGSKIYRRWQEEIGGKHWFKFKLAPDDRSVLDRWANRPDLTQFLNGFSTGLDAKTILNESTGAYGNAVVPQMVHQIFKSIQQYEDNANN